MFLHIGNKTYSSWSLRPWLLMKEKKIPFKQHVILFGKGSEGPTEEFKRQARLVSDSGKVPCLVVEAKGNDNKKPTMAVWDSMAITETLAETFPNAQIYPSDPVARSLCRSVCCEMHSGFGALRSTMTMNVTASFPQLGPRFIAERKDVKADVDRIVSIWTQLLRQYGGPFLFGKTFTASDAFYAPVVTRFVTYGVVPSLPHDVQAYVNVIMGLASMKEWIAGAIKEQKNGEFVPYQEQHRTAAEAMATATATASASKL